MPPTDAPLKAWWPTTQSLDLVEASTERTANAIQQEFSRIANGAPIKVERRICSDLNDAFGSIANFYNVPTTMIVLPTSSRWSVLWHNGFLCDGYDSLCWCLTSHHFLTTIHWSAHDEWTTFQSGASFCYRRHDGKDLMERVVQVAQTDREWDFFEKGKPLIEEDIAGYRAARKRDRLNERRITELLSRLGAEPWNEEFYSLPGEVTAISRPAAPTMLSRPRKEVLRPARQ